MSQVISLEEQRKKRANTSTSKSKSKQTTAQEKHGQTPIDDRELSAAETDTLAELIFTIERAKLQPFTTKSEFAREFANAVALCACEGFITTKLGDSQFTNVWMATSMGLQFLEEALYVLDN